MHHRWTIPSGRHLEGLGVMNICVFAGAGGTSQDTNDAYRIGEVLAKKGHVLYTGGSKKGVMGAVTEGAFHYDGRVYGVMPERIYNLGNYSPYQETIQVRNMTERKEIFWDKCQAFLCLPGGLGTIDELFEIACLVKLGYKPSSTPIVVLDTRGFYRPLRGMLEAMSSDGYVRESGKDIIKFRSSITWAVSELEGISSPDTVEDPETSV